MSEDKKDLVEQLRKWAGYAAAEMIDGPCDPKDTLYGAAANEIERLRRHVTRAEAGCVAAQKAALMYADRLKGGKR